MINMSMDSRNGFNHNPTPSVKMNSLLSNIIADDVNKSDDQNLEKKGLEQLFKFMDERKTKIKSGSSQFTPSEMKKMMSTSTSWLKCPLKKDINSLIVYVNF